MWKLVLVSIVAYSALLVVLYLTESAWAWEFICLLAVTAGVLVALYMIGVFSSLKSSFRDSVLTLYRRTKAWQFLVMVVLLGAYVGLVRHMGRAEVEWVRLMVLVLALIPGVVLAMILGWRAKLIYRSQ